MMFWTFQDFLILFFWPLTSSKHLECGANGFPRSKIPSYLWMLQSGDPKSEPRVGYNYKSVNLRGWTILYSRSAGHTLITHTCLQTKAADFTLKLLESSMLLKTCTNWTHIFAQKMCWRQSFNYKPLRLQNIYNSIKNFNNYICINLVACYYREF